MHSEHDKLLKPVYDAVTDPVYRRLEGFDSSHINTSKDIVTVADVVNQASRQIASKQLNHDWLCSLLAVSVIFGLLAASSVTLGLAASRLALVLEYVGGDVIQRMAEDVGATGG